MLLPSSNLTFLTLYVGILFRFPKLSVMFLFSYSKVVITRTVNNALILYLFIMHLNKYNISLDNFLMFKFSQNLMRLFNFASMRSCGFIAASSFVYLCTGILNTLFSTGKKL